MSHGTLSAAALIFHTKGWEPFSQMNTQAPAANLPVSMHTAIDNRHGGGGPGFTKLHEQGNWSVREWPGSHSGAHPFIFLPQWFENVRTTLGRDAGRWAGVAVLPLVPLLSVLMRGKGALQPPSLLLLLAESCRLIDQPQRTVPRWSTSVFYMCSPACTTQVWMQHISSTQIPSESLLQNNPFTLWGHYFYN